jgi:hypothetical protein
VKKITTRELERWLAAEEATAEQAEAAFAALFSALPLAAPPAGFAARVLERAGIAPHRGLLASVWVRLALAVSLAGAGAVIALVPGLGRGLAAVIDPVALVAAVPGLVAAVSEQLVEAVALAVKLLDLSRALVAPLATPSVAGALLVALLVAAAALRLLHHLISNERSWSYVVDAHG